MESLLEKLDPIPLFPNKVYYKHKHDGFIYNNHLGGPEFWKKHGNDFKARQSDIYIASMPRTGTTWTAEIVYLILNDLDYEKAKEKPALKRTPYLNFVETPEVAYDIPSPRCIKTHLPYTHLPESIKNKECKIIYTYRNPKDTLVSYFNFASMNSYIGYVGTFNEMFELFMQEKLCCGPYWKHFLSYWENRDKNNFFYISYEERKRDIIPSLKKMCRFLGKEFSDDQLRGLAEYTSFNSMKSNPAVNFSGVNAFNREKSDFIRKGEVGDWKNYLSAEQSKQVDEYVRKYFEETGVEFEYELKQ